MVVQALIFLSGRRLRRQKKGQVAFMCNVQPTAHEQPLAWLISTNGFVREAFFDSKYSYCSKVAMWEDGFHDYRMLPLLYELDSRDEWTNPKAWGKANPGLGKIKSIVTLADQVEKGKKEIQPSCRPFLTKDFNMPENTSAAAMTYEGRSLTKRLYRWSS